MMFIQQSSFTKKENMYTNLLMKNKTCSGNNHNQEQESRKLVVTFYRAPCKRRRDHHFLHFLPVFAHPIYRYYVVWLLFI